MNPLLPALLLLLACTLSAQPPSYSRAQISLSPERTIGQLAALGLDVEHGAYAPQKFFSGDFSEEELTRIHEAGFEYEVLIDDVVAYYRDQQAEYETGARTVDCPDQSSVPKYAVPDHFEPGSMGGYFTYQEMLDELDEMAAAYPDLISVRQPISATDTTWDGNYLYWVKISDFPTQDEAEPEVLYTSLHHAREPMSLSQLIFYMWYLLENYGQDPEITYLVDQTELYFVPCVNPDGYLFNELNNPNGGGLWRKNRRPNINENAYGVDLNRNYGYEWGYDNNGSSPNPTSSLYRGPAPFSEPETQLMKSFCEEREFVVALNYHSYGNLLLYPFGYTDLPTPDHDTYTHFAEALTRENGYATGLGIETLGYFANGNSDDWMYGEATTKPSIFSMTPEVGPDAAGFWPPSVAIVSLCRQTLLQNLTAAHLPLVYGLARHEQGSVLSELEGSLPVELTRYGLTDGPLTVQLVPLSSNILDTGSPQTFSLDFGETASTSIGFTLDPAIAPEEEVVFRLEVGNGSGSWGDTLRKIYRPGPVLIFEDPLDELANWPQTDNWGLSQQKFYSAPTAMADSPTGNYGPNADNELWSELIAIDSAAAALLTFYASWDIEESFDYVQVNAVDSALTTFTPLCGKYTNPGAGFFQPLDEPLYDGTQVSWVAEEMSLDDYLGKKIYLQFVLRSDGGVQGDGFFFDDLRITVYTNDSSLVHTLPEPTAWVRLQVSPNPANQVVTIDWQPLADFSLDEPQMEIYDLLGRRIHHQAVGPGATDLDTGSWLPGTYLLRLSDRGRLLAAKRLIINRN